MISYWTKQMGRSTHEPRMEDYLDLDIRRVLRTVRQFDEANPFVWQWFRRDQLRAAVVIQPTQGGVQLIQGGADQSTVFIRVLTTPCNYGGVRVWWSCPRCFRRVAILYAGRQFACRKCHRLTFTSQKTTRWDRAIAKAEKVRSRLRWEPGIAYGTGPKPKGMHWATYRALVKMHNDLAGAAMYAMSTLRMFRQKIE